MDYKSQTCCFTGHRDIAPYTPDTVFEQTKAIVTLLVSKGFKYFGTGGALGFDTIAAQAVLSVKETHPEVKLILVLPCENQTKFWKQQDIDVYNDIKLRADKVKVLAPHYYNGCMQKRNRHLVDCSSACLSLFYQLGRLFKNNVDNRRKADSIKNDKKLMSKIQEKKIAHGLKM